MKTIVLDNISVKSNLVEYHFSCSKELDRYFTTKTMFIEYEESIENVPISILTIPFVNCMLGLVWMSNSALFVDEIDETYYSIIPSIKRAYEELHQYPGLKGLFVPSIIRKNEINHTQKSILLFGGGVDCHSSYLRNSEKVSYVLNIYGWLNNIDEVNGVDLFDKKITENFAQRMGVTALHARSNFASQFCLSKIDKELSKNIGSSFWFGLLHPMAFISIATPLAWNYGVAEIVIASSNTKGRVNWSCGSIITTDSEYRYAVNGKVIHDGFELNRNQKVALIVDYQKKTGRPYNLQVCSFNECNCCRCEKCFRTIVDIISLGGDPSLYGFDYYSKEHWVDVVNSDIAMWGVDKEYEYYYYYTEKKMKENYNNILYKDFADWFLACNFKQMKKDALRKYYKQNFFSILKRKLHI